jgi:hypothetical protein
VIGPTTPFTRFNITSSKSPGGAAPAGTTAKMV